MLWVLSVRQTNLTQRLTNRLRNKDQSISFIIPRQNPREKQAQYNYVITTCSLIIFRKLKIGLE
jgi:hypothetical protein